MKDNNNFLTSELNAEAYLNESSLSRLLSKMEKHDTGTITAYRSKDYDRDGNVVKEYTHKENQQRNRSLLAKLMNKGYLVTSVKGSYIENFGTPEAKEVGEHVFFVEDAKDTGNLKEDLIELGEEFNQDSVFYIPKGGKEATLIGTNNAEFPGYHKEVQFGSKKLGKTGEFMTRVGNKPFFFESIDRFNVPPTNYLSKQALFKIAEKHWSKIDV